MDEKSLTNLSHSPLPSSSLTMCSWQRDTIKSNKILILWFCTPKIISLIYDMWTGSAQANTTFLNFRRTYKRKSKKVMLKYQKCIITQKLTWIISFGLFWSAFAAVVTSKIVNWLLALVPPQSNKLIWIASRNELSAIIMLADAAACKIMSARFIVIVS